MDIILNKMQRDMELRGFSSHTVDNYIRGARRFLGYFAKSPLELGVDEINQFQHYISDELGYSWSSFNIHVCAIRFLYNITLREKRFIDYIPFHKRRKKLPIVLSKEEVEKIILLTENIRHKAMIATLYACGIRISELVNLKISNIDSKRMLVHIEDGKGNKDRYVVLSVGHLVLLRKYYLAQKRRPKLYLFCGKDPYKPISVRPIQTLVKKAAARAGVTKNISPHTFRHSYATHMLENGFDIRKIQMLLGHSSLRTTANYLHVVSGALSKVTSPLEGMAVYNDRMSAKV